MKVIKYIGISVVATMGTLSSIAIIRDGMYGQGGLVIGASVVIIYALINFKKLDERSKATKKERKITRKQARQAQESTMHIKVGLRKPSLKKSIKARTTAKWKREIKRTLIPGYGKKGMGWLRDPKRAMYNKVYKKTTKSIWDIFK